MRCVRVSNAAPRLWEGSAAKLAIASACLDFPTAALLGRPACSTFTGDPTVMTRREMIRAARRGAVLIAAPSLIPATARAQDAKLSTAYGLPKLPYAYDALEPHIDAKTMEIHHTKHHQAYVDNLNKALGGQAGRSRSRKCSANLKDVPEASRTAVRNNGGGPLEPHVLLGHHGEGRRRAEGRPAEGDRRLVRRAGQVQEGVQGGGAGAVRQRVGVAGAGQGQAAGDRDEPRTRTTR